MGDMGDYWREARDFKRAMRRAWVECPSPGCQFGGNPVKVPPGGKCRHCGWLAPGSAGEDVRYARQDERRREQDEATKEAERKRKLALRTCRSCGKAFKNEQARANHERDVHKKAMAKVQQT